MYQPEEKHDTYLIPPNFIEGGTLFGGAFKLRNVIEAGILVAAVGIPVLMLELTLTAKIIVLCLTALPLGLLALIGISGESLSSHVLAFFKFLQNRRVIRMAEEKEPKKAVNDKKGKPKAEKARFRKQATSNYLNPCAEYLPIEKIENGIIYTRDHRYVKIIEVVPINFLLRSGREQRSIIYSFIS